MEQLKMVKNIYSKIRQIKSPVLKRKIIQRKGIIQRKKPELKPLLKRQTIIRNGKPVKIITNRKGKIIWSSVKKPKPKIKKFIREKIKEKRRKKKPIYLKYDILVPF